MYRSTRSRSPSSPSARKFACWVRSGTRSATAARARCRALFTEATLVESISADLERAETQHLAQDQHRPLVGREVLERGDEGELDTLELLVAASGAARPGAEPDRRSG